MASSNPFAPPVEFPQDVLDLLRGTFADCNREVSSVLSRMPTAHEETLDQNLINLIGQFAPTRTAASGWLIEMETHFIGGGHHFGRFEVADIGVLVRIRSGKKTVWTKVALLQSKRLFPDGEPYEPKKDEQRLMHGFGSLIDKTADALSYYRRRTFRFTRESQYCALDLTHEQAERVASYETEFLVPIHYMFYNPLQIPWTRTLPITPPEPKLGENAVGARIVQSDTVRSLRPRVKIPRYADIEATRPPHAFAPYNAGWRLEDFMIDLVLACHEGKVTAGLDETLDAVFYRRNYPIAAAFAVTIEPG